MQRLRRCSLWAGGLLLAAGLATEWLLPGWARLVLNVAGIAVYAALIVLLMRRSS